MADLERNLTLLAERGNQVGSEELIGRLEARLAEDPLVVVTKQRKGWGMSVQTDQKRQRKQSSPIRGLALAAVAFIAIVGLAALYFALDDDSESDVVQPAPSTTVVTESTATDPAAVVTAGLAAYYGGDYETAETLFNFASSHPGWDAADVQADVAYREMVDAQVDVDCIEPAEVAIAAECLVVYGDNLSRAIYGEESEIDGLTAERMTVVVMDGRINRFEYLGSLSAVVSMGVYLAEIGEFDGYENCVTDKQSPFCAEIQNANMAGFEKWLSDFDPTEVVTTGLNAWFEGDCALALTMIGNDVLYDQLSECLAGGPTGLMAYERSVNADVEVLECDFDPDQESAACRVAYSNSLNAAVGSEPAVQEITFTVLADEKALWDYKSEFYRSRSTYPHDEMLDASFEAFAEASGLGIDYLRSCKPLPDGAQCADLINEHLDEWAAWHLANN